MAHATAPRRPSRRGTRLLLGGSALVFVAALASPAAATVVSGTCTGSAEFLEGGVTITESTDSNTVVEVPAEDTVHYMGHTGGAPSDSPIEFTGSVGVELPFAQTWIVEDWSGATMEVSASGDHTYEVPGFVPKGTGSLLVTATHQHGDAETCVVEVRVAVAGDPGPAALGAAAGTALAATGMLASGIKKRGVA